MRESSRMIIVTHCEWIVAAEYGAQRGVEGGPRVERGPTLGYP